MMVCAIHRYHIMHSSRQSNHIVCCSLKLNRHCITGGTDLFILPQTHVAKIWLQTLLATDRSKAVVLV